MAGLGDLAGKAQQLLQSDKVRKSLHSTQAEGVSDKLLDAAAGTAKKISGGKHDEAIENARNRADEAVGDR